MAGSWVYVLMAADPLRVLRGLRFSARFDFELDAQLEDAASSKEVCLSTLSSNDAIMHPSWAEVKSQTKAFLLLPMKTP